MFGCSKIVQPHPVACSRARHRLNVQSSVKASHPCIAICRLSSKYKSMSSFVYDERTELNFLFQIPVNRQKLTASVHHLRNMSQVMEEKSLLNKQKTWSTDGVRGSDYNPSNDAQSDSSNRANIGRKILSVQARPDETMRGIGSQFDRYKQVESPNKFELEK